MPVDVRTVAGVELLRTGVWQCSNGTFEIRAEHLRSAVEAASAGVLPPPPLKLGHKFHQMSDGAPALGSAARLRLADDGAMLVADFIGVPSKIAKILWAAWPNRSIEGSFEFTDHTGKTWPFVIEAVAMLGGELPAVKPLRSLADVAELYGLDDIAAAGRGRHVVIAAGASAPDLDARRKRAVAVAAARRCRASRTIGAAL